jgi:hypothetical protein
MARCLNLCFRILLTECGVRYMSLTSHTQKSSGVNAGMRGIKGHVLLLLSQLR